MAYVDKINPEIPEGRILIIKGDIILKDESAPTSPMPLLQKAQKLMDFIKEKGYSHYEIECMKEAYGLVERFEAFRKVDMYNKLRKRHPKLAGALMRWLLFDFYDILPSNRKISYSAYDNLTLAFRNLLDDCMREAKDCAIRDLTISVEASMTANFFSYLQEEGIETIYQLDEPTLRKYSKIKGSNPELLHRIGIFLSRYAKQNNDAKLLEICALFPGERSQKKVYQSLTKEERDAFEKFLLDENIEISLRDRAIGILHFYTGIRKEDVENMELSNIDWTNDRINIKMLKTGQDLSLPLRPVVGNAIYRYITEERPKDAGKRLFVTEKKYKGEYASVDTAYIINKLYDRSGIRWGRVRRGTHLLRHSFADELINQGNDLSTVSNMLGHRDPNVTVGYLSANIEQLRLCALDVTYFPITHKLYTDGTNIN